MTSTERENRRIQLRKDRRIQDLEETINLIFRIADICSQSQQAGDSRQCQMAQQSFCEAYGYLVEHFGVRTLAEAKTLLSNLKNDRNFQALPNSGAQLEGNPIDHLESILAFSRP